MTPEEILNQLPSFTGTEYYYRHMRLIYTDGVKFVAENCGAYWLLDLINSYQIHYKVRTQEFQVYKLFVRENKTAFVEISNGNNKILATQEIEYSDFPLPKMEIWCINYKESNPTCILPSEY
jgi:hypothetical protein